MTTKSNITLSLSLILSIGLFTTPIYAVEKEQSKASTPTDKWAWLAGTTWVVPPNNVRGYMLAGGNPPNSPPNLIELNDQTVYTIEGYKNGYFWGTFVLALQRSNGGPVIYECSSMLSPISPDGDLLIGSTMANGVQNMGVGNMVKVKGQWTMKNLKVGGYTHWAYMVQSKPTDASYNDLPFVHLSVPEMLAKCPNFTPTTP